MKKIITLLALLTMTALCLTACGDKVSKSMAKSGKINIVTTIFPEYDWVKEILGDKADGAELTMLLDNGVDLHSFQPTAADILKISTCDLFIYVGGESDEWVDEVLASAANKDMVVINLLDVLGDRVKPEEIVEGMEHDHDHDHDHEEGEDHDHDHEEGEDHDHEEDEDHDHDHEHEHEEEELDEHVWLSLRNAEVLCEAITDAIVKIDAGNAETYKANLNSYKEKLSALDKEYTDAIKEAKVKTLLFGDRFPFRYLTDDYGLNYYAAFAGCSAESEASFETILFLSGKVDELGLKAVMTIEGTNHRIAETVRDNTASKNQTILSLDSMQGTTSKDIKNGINYLTAMKANLEVIKEALK